MHYLKTYITDKPYNHNCQLIGNTNFAYNVKPGRPSRKIKSHTYLFIWIITENIHNNNDYSRALPNMGANFVFSQKGVFCAHKCIQKRIV
jgi:hypothetical protein